MMNILRDINPDIKVTVFFGVGAFLLSLFVGLIFGVGIGTVFIRSFIFMAFFAGIAFGSLLVLKIFVPEIYNLFQGKSETAEDSAVLADINEEGAEKGENVSPSVESEAGDDSVETTISEDEKRFSELNQEDLPHMTSGEASAQGPVNVEAGKLGKHVLQTEKLTKYEPKIIAQAIRTMISKDEA